MLWNLEHWQPVLSGHAFGEVFKTPLYLKCLGLSQGFLPDFGPWRQQAMIRGAGCCCSRVRLAPSSQIPSLTWPSAGSCRHLGNGPGDGRPLSVLLPPPPFLFSFSLPLQLLPPSLWMPAFQMCGLKKKAHSMAKVFYSRFLVFGSKYPKWACMFSTRGLGKIVKSTSGCLFKTCILHSSSPPSPIPRFHLLSNLTLPWFTLLKESLSCSGFFLRIYGFKTLDFPRSFLLLCPLPFLTPSLFRSPKKLSCNASAFEVCARQNSRAHCSMP